MPHIIIEYSRALESRVDFPALLGTLHETLADQGIDVARIKTRGIALDHAVVGERGVEGSMVHGTLLLLEGRDVATKRRYGDALYNVMKTILQTVPACAVTLEMRDMVKETYYL